jgi:hypothetical protein
MEGGGKNASGDKMFVFLKAEGHTAFQIAHLKAFWAKLKTGEGATANPYLNNLAKDNPGMVQARGAENYSKSYEQLVKAVGLHGKTVTVREVLAEVFSLTRARLQSHPPAVHPPLPAIEPQAILDKPSSQIRTFVNDQLRPVIATLDPGWANYHAQNLMWLGAFNTVVRDGSLNGVLDQMSRDAELSGDDQTPRYFQEITVDPAHLNTALRALRSYLGINAR